MKRKCGLTREERRCKRLTAYTWYIHEWRPVFVVYKRIGEDCYILHWLERRNTYATYYVGDKYVHHLAPYYWEWRELPVLNAEGYRDLGAEQ